MILIVFDTFHSGTYQVDKSDNEKFSDDQRRGRLYLFRQKEDSKLEVFFSFTDFLRFLILVFRLCNLSILEPFWI